MPIMDHFSVAVFPWGRKPPTMNEVVEAAQFAEKLGFYSVNVPLMNAIPDAGPFGRFGNKSILDARVLLPAIIADTSKIRIAVDSIPLPYLPPFDWAKYFASLDVISNGRVIVGMCLGMVDEAFHAVGADRRKRGAIADEQLEIITRLWTEDEVTYDGRFYKLSGVSMEPKPVQKPYPPIWWGGRAVSIPRAARYCEYINPPWPTFDELKDVYLPRIKDAPMGKWGQKPKVSAWIYSNVTEGRDLSTSEIEDYFSGLMDLGVRRRHRCRNRRRLPRTERRAHLQLPGRWPRPLRFRLCPPRRRTPRDPHAPDGPHGQQSRPPPLTLRIR